MSISREAWSRLAGLWGSYDFRIIRDKHFSNSADLVENFLEHHSRSWNSSHSGVDAELLSNIEAVRSILYRWADEKLSRFGDSRIHTTVQSHIMFKTLHYGRGRTISFGSDGHNWRKKVEIAAELDLYRPWSVRHAAAVLGGKPSVYRQMLGLVKASKSPTEQAMFEAWWALDDNDDRPMLFPQVSGHTTGKFWIETPKAVRPLHFDFGLVNVVTQRKILIECDSRRYHSDDSSYQSDRDRR